MPNVLTEVAIQGILIERQPYPYPSSCFKNWEETNYTNYIEKEWNYTLQQCQRVRKSFICIRSIRKFREIDLHFKNQRLVVILPFWKLVDVSIQCFWTKMMKNLWKDLPAI